MEHRPAVPCRDGRSPHGERGLKYVKVELHAVGGLVALLMESVD